MDILLSALFSAALQIGLPCIEASGSSIEFRGGRAQLQGPYRVESSGNGPRGAQRRDLTVPERNGNREDLLFYVSSHAQAVSDLSEAPWMSWLELRTFAGHPGSVSPESKRATSPGVGGAENACGSFAAHNDMRGKRSLSPRAPSAMVSERLEWLMVVNKR